MSAPTDGGPAFPLAGSNDYSYPPQDGMTLRDWFAGMALTGELASLAGEACVEATAKAAIRAGRTACEQVAANCYEMADAMLAARGKEEA